MPPEPPSLSLMLGMMRLHDEALLSLSRQEWYALLKAARGHEMA